MKLKTLQGKDLFETSQSVNKLQYSFYPFNLFRYGYGKDSMAEKTRGVPGRVPAHRVGGLDNSELD